ncbi:MAG: autoinducer-2 kinase [Lachnospiraceae bacterium]|nr:autoinducer-2 kinase [Lachnospiraceae bacterium]
MTDQLFLAVDAGTGSVRAVLFDTDGRQIGVVQEEWTHLSDPAWPGSMDFDWEHNWALACSCIRAVLEQTKTDPARIAAVSTTCMREGILLYDREGKEIWACANVDSRAVDEVRALVEKDRELEKQLYARSGEAYALGALPRLLFVKNKMPDIYEKTAAVGMFNDWLIYKMTGVLKVEPSNGSTTGIFDLRTRTWDPGIAKAVGIRTDIFPESCECGERIACVSKKGADDTGLKEGTPVVSGGGDCQLGCIGVGAVHADDAAVFGGSFWQYEYNTAKALTDPACRIRVNCHALKGLWQYEALAFQPGLVMRWYRDAFCAREKEIAKETGADPYDLMNEEAKKIPAGCYGMMCTFSDVMNFTSWRHAAPTFTGFDIDPEKYHRITFYRAILENAALVTYEHMRLVEEVTGHAPKEITFAGGASKSPLWCQILSDVTGLAVRVPVVREATALGAAMLAGVGCGIYADIDEAVKRCVKTAHTYTPDDTAHGVYQDMIPVWKKVYAAQLALSDAHVTRYMWCAPGASA